MTPTNRKIKINDITVSEKELYEILTNEYDWKIILPFIQICEICGSEFIHNRNKKVKCCSDVCRKKYLKRDDIKIKQKNNTKIALREKYGVEHPSQIEGFVDKVKKTKKEKYGDENYVNTRKCKKTKKEKYGNENYNNIKLNKKTKKEKYGNENYNNRNKFINTMKSKYGGIGIQLNHILKKSSDSMLNKYGVKHGFQSNEIIEKIQENNIKKYGKKTYWGSELQKKNKFEEKIKNILPILNKMNIQLLSNYNGCKTNDKINYYKFKCLNCQTEFEDTFANGKIPICKKCNDISQYRSNGENEICDYISNILPSANIQINNKRIIYPYELDIYIPEKNIGVEYNGLYWHSESSGNKDKKYHLNKTELCNEKNIELIHIFENEWITKNDIVKSIIKSKFNMYEHIIYARKCEIKEISTEEKNDFLNKNHLQGKDTSSVRIGLFYKNELISVMTFGKSRFNKNIQWEMVRFANKLNFKIIGGASKLFKYFINKYDVNSIISYSDRRYFNGNLYEKLGFDFSGVSSPNYFYIDFSDPYNLKNRIQFQKHKLNEKLEHFDENLTEWENMQLNGYDRIWDCGNKKFIWKN